MIPLSAEDTRLLESLPVLKRLSDEARSEVLNDANLRTFQAGEFAVVQDEVGDAFYIVLDGQLEVCKILPNGREVRVGDIATGNYFGEQALLHSGIGKRSASVRATRESRCIEVPREQFARHIEPVQQNRAEFDQVGKDNLHKNMLKSLEVFREFKIDISGDGAVTIEVHQAGDRVVQQGDPADSVYFVLDGVALAIKFHESAYVELARVGPGQCFGELGVIRSQPRAASVVAESELRLLRIGATQFIEWHEKYPQLRDFLTTLEQVYPLANGKQLSVYRGTYKGRPSISTLYGDPTGNCVLSTKVIDENIFVLTNGRQYQEYHSMKFDDPETGVSRELHLHEVERSSKGKVIGGVLVGVVAVEIQQDIGGLYQKILHRSRLKHKDLTRFRRTGHLGGAMPRKDPELLCRCLQLGKKDVRAAIAGGEATVAAVQRTTGAGAICGSCKPDILEFLTTLPMSEIAE